MVEKMKAASRSVLFLALLSSVNFGTPLSAQHRCRIWDSSCMTLRAQALVPYVTAGFPELGLERLDVMVIDGLHLNQDGFKTDWGTIYYHGLKNAVIHFLSINLYTKEINLVFHSDYSLKSHYVGEGSLGSAPFFGNGEVTMQFDNLWTEMVIPFELITDVDGKTIINMKSYNYWYDIKNGAFFHFDNLFYGDQERSVKAHRNVNQKWKPLTTQFGRSLFDLVNDKIFNAIRTYMLSQPINNLTFL